MLYPLPSLATRWRLANRQKTVQLRKGGRRFPPPIYGELAYIIPFGIWLVRDTFGNFGERGRGMPDCGRLAPSAGGVSVGVLVSERGDLGKSDNRPYHLAWAGAMRLASHNVTIPRPKGWGTAVATYPCREVKICVVVGCMRQH